LKLKPILLAGLLISLTAEARVTKYYLTAKKAVTEARAAYAKGDFLKAAGLYNVVPPSSPYFLRTREELAWSYLRSNQFDQLRGVLKDLNSKLVPSRWRLEGRVLSAMLNLRECRYQDTKTDLAEFSAEMTPLARTVEGKIQKGKNLEYWKNLESEIREALLKMQFVRTELRGRLLLLSRGQSLGEKNPLDQTPKIAANDQTFPVGDDLWSDEVFLGRSKGESVCAVVHK
jgi:hypothetical protein